MNKPPLATPIASLLIASLLVPPAFAGGTGASVGTSYTETTVRSELSRRQARQQLALEEILPPRYTDVRLVGATTFARKSMNSSD